MSKRLLFKRKLSRFIKLHIDKATVEWCFIFVLVLVAFGIFNFLLMPQIWLNGGRNILVNYKDKYSENGFKASFMGNDLTGDVISNGSVNTRKLGKYRVVYTLKTKYFTKKVVRVVNVVDREKPKLDIDSNDIYLCPGSDVVPSKIVAHDNYDGDISNSVKYDISKDSITYYVTDSSGNKASITKKLIYKDNEGPTISFSDGDYLYLHVGDIYNKAYNVSDNCSDDISVKTKGSVDTSKPGFYDVSFIAIDKSGNKSRATQHVIVSNVNADGTIYLTFDDGPREGTTNIILDILKEENVKATFFVTNSGPDYLIKREFDEGHSIGLHSSSHDYSIVYASSDSFYNDLYSVQNRVKNITGYESHIIRFPGGSSNTVSRRYSEGIMSYLTRDVVSRGFKYYDWNLSSGDAEGGQHTAEEIKNNVINGLRKDRANVILMHDIKPYTRDALMDIIKYGKENGYVFDVISMNTDMVTQHVNN